MDKRVKWNGEETYRIFGFLESLGFENQDDVSERYDVFSKEVNGVDIDVTFDYDPWMHIDETDDEIDYSCSVYVYVDSEYDYSELSGRIFYSYAEDIVSLKSIIEDKINYIIEKECE